MADLRLELVRGQAQAESAGLGVAVTLLGQAERLLRVRADGTEPSVYDLAGAGRRVREVRLGLWRTKLPPRPAPRREQFRSQRDTERQGKREDPDSDTAYRAALREYEIMAWQERRAELSAAIGDVDASCDRLSVAIDQRIVRMVEEAHSGGKRALDWIRQTQGRYRPNFEAHADGVLQRLKAGYFDLGSHEHKTAISEVLEFARRAEAIAWDYLSEHPYLLTSPGAAPWRLSS